MKIEVWPVQGFPLQEKVPWGLGVQEELMLELTQILLKQTNTQNDRQIYQHVWSSNIRERTIFNHSVHELKVQTCGKVNYQENKVWLSKSLEFLPFATGQMNAGLENKISNFAINIFEVMKSLIDWVIVFWICNTGQLIRTENVDKSRTHLSDLSE